MEGTLDFYRKALEELRDKSNFRTLPDITHKCNFILSGGRQMLNLSSNDYLGLSSDTGLREEFLKTLDSETFIPSSSSSRLLTGNSPEYRQLEETMAGLFGTEAALIFNSGYHANTGIIPAICDKSTLILADKLVHASMIDGIKLSGSTFYRYRHNDLNHLESLIVSHRNEYRRILVLTESIFSMDGDVADLNGLVELKHRYPGTMLYVDEAHAIGVRGRKGLGVAEEKGCIKDIDFLVGTFGKAIDSVGAYIVCPQIIRDYLINRMRPFIFTTALPPVNIRWTDFIMKRIPDMTGRREHLERISAKVRKYLEESPDYAFGCCSESHIIPFMIGKSADAMEKARLLQDAGFYLLAIRPPTVPEGTSRIRLSLTASITEAQTDSLISALL